MPGFNLDDYEPVADRIERFWKDHPRGRITTDLVHHDEKSFIVKASIYLHRDDFDLVVATGYAEEIIGSTNVNRTSALENCETSAIGRALANLGYAVKNRASREEMAKAQPQPRPRSGPQQRTPRQDSPTATETAPRATEPPAPSPSADNGTNPETLRIQRELLAAVNGDKPRAKMIWRTTLETFGLGVGDEIPSDMLGPIETAVKAVPV